MEVEFILCPIGTFGDIKPFLELGTRLHSRGHRVLIATAAPFRKHAEERGLEFAPTLTQDFYQGVLRDPRLWHRTRYFEVILEGFIIPSLRPVVEIVRSQPDPGRLLLAAAYSGNAAARLAQEVTGARMVSIWVDAAGLRSKHAPPVISGAEFVARLPQPIRNFIYGLLYAYTDWRALPLLNAERRALGLRPVNSMLDWMVSSEGSLGLYPDWYAPEQPDWPVNYLATGFPVADSNLAIPPEVERFLGQGEPPVVITFGTGILQAEPEFMASLQACQALGLRALLISPGSGLCFELPKDAMAAGYVPFDRLLPQAKALIHHGGMGTSCQAIAAGIPQLVIPLAHDQPDNAARLMRLGVGRSLSRSKALQGGVATELARLLGSNSLPNCQRLAASVAASPNGLDLACDALERFWRLKPSK